MAPHPAPGLMAPFGRLPPFIATTGRMPAPDMPAPDAQGAGHGGGDDDGALLSHPAPALPPEAAAAIAERVFGIRGSLRMLSSERDANFHLRLNSGEQALLKITNAAEDRAVTAMQTAALAHLAAVAPDLPVQRVCATLEGAPWQVVGIGGQDHVVRLLTWLDGTMLHAATPGPGLHRAVGAMLARLALGLRGFFHPAAGHALQWDIKQAGRLRPMLDAVGDGALRARLAAHLDRFDATVAPRLPHLRAQVVHNDFNPHNLVVDAAGGRVTGIIDFGDMVHTPLACDLAVACSYHLTDDAAPLARVAELVAGHAAVLPPEAEELALLPDLIRLRHVTTLVITAWRARRYPGNAAYILRNAAASHRGLDAIDRLGIPACAALLRDAIPSARTE